MVGILKDGRFRIWVEHKEALDRVYVMTHNTENYTPLYDIRFELDKMTKVGVSGGSFRERGGVYAYV